MAEEYRSISDQVVQRRKELAAARAPGNHEGLGTQAGFNRFVAGESGDVVTPIGSRPVRRGAIAVGGAAPGATETIHALEQPGVDEQTEWDTFTRMPGEMGADLQADRTRAGLGVPESPTADAPQNVVPLQPRQPQ